MYLAIVMVESHKTFPGATRARSSSFILHALAVGT
jgi:hypothetical protein